MGFFEFSCLGFSQLLESEGLCLLPNLGNYSAIISLNTFRALLSLLSSWEFRDTNFDLLL